MKENKKTIQVLAIVTLLIAVVCISVGFALMSTTLTINGSAEVVPAKWSVHYVHKDNSGVELTNPYTFSNNSTAACEAHDTDCAALRTAAGDTATVTAPTLTDTAFGNYQVVLTKPGDKGTYTFDVTNDGNLDAIVAGVTPSTYATDALTITGTTGDTKTADETAVTGNITYKVVWAATDAPITANDTLNAGQTKTVKVEVEYLSTATTLPQKPVTITGRDVSILFQQKN